MAFSNIKQANLLKLMPRWHVNLLFCYVLMWQLQLFTLPILTASCIQDPYHYRHISAACRPSSVALYATGIGLTDTQNFESHNKNSRSRLDENCEIYYS